MEPGNNRVRQSVIRDCHDHTYGNDDEEKSIAPKNNIFGQFKMKPYEARINACNGDCGSIIAEIIDCCAHSKVL